MHKTSGSQAVNKLEAGSVREQENRLIIFWNWMYTFQVMKVEMFVNSKASMQRCCYRPIPEINAYFTNLMQIGKGISERD